MGCSLSGTKIYITGGCASDQVYEPYSECLTVSNNLFAYSPDSDKWEILADMPRIRYRHSSVVAEGKIYLFGGVNQSDAIVREVDIYDIASNKWSTLSTPFVSASTDHTAFVLDKKIVIAGGYLSDMNYLVLANTHYFDIPTQTFQYNVTNLNQARGDLCSGVIDGKAYVNGGYQTDFCKPTNYMEEFDLASGKWTSKKSNDIPTDANGGEKGDQGCFVMNGKFYAIGGEEKTSNCFSDPLYDADSYDPKADNWVVEKSLYLNAPRFRFCTVAYQNKVFRFGGQGPLQTDPNSSDRFHQIFDEVQVYVFEQNSSSMVTPFAFLLSMIVALVLFF